jgi:hypothetical protein
MMHKSKVKELFILREPLEQIHVQHFIIITWMITKKIKKNYKRKLPILLKMKTWISRALCLQSRVQASVKTNYSNRRAKKSMLKWIKPRVMKCSSRKLNIKQKYLLNSRTRFKKYSLNL